MPKTATSPQQFAGLTDEEIDELVAHPHWESLGDELDRLMALIPVERPQCERTTMLTWIYQQQGVMSFLELSDRITGFRPAGRGARHCRLELRRQLTRNRPSGRFFLAAAPNIWSCRRCTALHAPRKE